MNRIHRILFNRRLGIFQAVSEHARRRGAGTPASATGACALVLLLWTSAQAQPVFIDDRHEIVDNRLWEVGTDLTVGSSASTGPSEMTIRNHGEVRSGAGRVGHLGGIGVVTVTGPGARWESGLLSIGNSGQGTLNISAGASVRAAGTVTLGTNSTDAKGTGMVTGSGSELRASGALSIGHIGSATLTVDDRALVNAPQVFLGGIPSTLYAGSGELKLQTSGVLATNYLEVGRGSGRVGLDGGVLRAASATSDFLRNFAAGDIRFEAGGAFIDSNGYDIGIDTPLSGPGRLHKLGPGTLTLSASNPYQGGTTVAQGILAVNHDGALGSGPVALTDSQAQLDLSGHPGSLDIGSLSGQGQVFLGGNTLILGSLGQDDDFSGVLQNGGLAGGATGALIKTGAGTLTLSGNNSYSGATTVQEGVLLVHGDASNSSLLTVRNGATLGGLGRVGNTVIETGGTLHPGDSGVGTLFIQGDLTLAPGAMLHYGLGSPGPQSNPGTGISGRVHITGALTLDGVLNLTQSGNPADGAASLGYYRLMTYDGLLTDHGLVLGQLPYASVDPYLIEAGGGRVDLFIPAAGLPGDDSLQHWQGGDGLWSASNPQWLNQGGDIPATWAGKHAVFKQLAGAPAGGKVNVDGAQRFQGLQFVDEGYRLQGTGLLETIAGMRSEVRVLAERAEIATEVGGAGALAKTGAGMLVLSAANTYAGGTLLADGVLSVSADTHLGDADGALSFDGGVLQVTGTGFTASSRQILWGAGGGGFDIVDAAHDLRLAQDITGPGELVKRGAGTLTLTGDNAYGNTRVENGRLLGDAQSISGHIANAGVVEFTQESDARFAGDIGALGGVSGRMIKSGAGTLTLDGRSALDWSIASGTLVADAIRLAGNVSLEGGTSGLRLSGATNSSYEGVISGQGRLSVDGGAELLLSGDSSGFSGSTLVSAGTLRVGDAQGRGALGGSLDVLEGATLSGSGAIGNGPGSQVTIASGATLAPGNSIGTLTIAGDLVLQPGARFEVEVSPESMQSDQVVVTGNAVLNGGVVAHIGSHGAYAPRSSYTLLKAGGQLSGAFEQVSTDFAFLRPSLTYHRSRGTIELELARNDRRLDDPALTRNQAATAAGIESMGWTAAHPVYDAVVLLPDDAGLLRAAFDALSGEIHASTRTALIEDSRFVRQAAAERLRAVFAAQGAAHDAPAPVHGALLAADAGPVQHPGPVLWSQAFGSWGNTRSDANASSLVRKTGGLLIGADRQAGPWRLGLLAGYSQSDVKARERASSSKSDNFHLGLYAGIQARALGLRTGLAYTRHAIDTQRSVALPTLGDQPRAAYHAHTWQAFGELAYGLDASSSRWEPFINLAHVRLHTGSYDERGGTAALAGASTDTDLSFATLGLRVEHRLGSPTRPAVLRGLAGWRHAFGNTTPTARHGFSAGDAFSVAGAPIAKDSLVLEAGLELRLASDSTLGLSYSGQLSGPSRAHEAQARLKMRF